MWTPSILFKKLDKRVCVYLQWECVFFIRVSEFNTQSNVSGLKTQKKTWTHLNNSKLRLKIQATVCYRLELNGQLCMFRVLSYLGECFLAVIFQVSWIHIHMVVVSCERLWEFSDGRHKLFHLKRHLPSIHTISLTEGKIGRRHTVYTNTHKKDLKQQPITERQVISLNQSKLNMCLLVCVYNQCVLFSLLLLRSGATLSTVTSKLPRITGSLAIFSGLRRKTNTEKAR